VRILFTYQRYKESFTLVKLLILSLRLFIPPLQGLSRSDWLHEGLHHSFYYYALSGLDKIELAYLFYFE
jgi:hypothetical protein